MRMTRIVVKGSPRKFSVAPPSQSSATAVMTAAARTTIFAGRWRATVTTTPTVLTGSSAAQTTARGEFSKTKWSTRWPLNLFLCFLITYLVAESWDHSTTPWTTAARIRRRRTTTRTTDHDYYHEIKMSHWYQTECEYSTTWLRFGILNFYRFKLRLWKTFSNSELFLAVWKFFKHK